MERGIANNTLEVQSLKGEVQDLKEQLKSAAEIVYSFSDVLTIFSKITDTLEGRQLLKKIQEAKHKAEYQNKKEDAQISAINPLAEKPEKMPKIKTINK
ncbi:MAG: hypothetical protein JW702_11210 [Clostridiales bacterium]|nr:hypothetical protein [Clostridiales bacterium]